MKKILLTLILLSLIFLPLINAEGNLGTFKQKTNVNLIQVCNCTSVNITNILYPNGSVILSNVVMTASGTYFNYTLSSVYTDTQGFYIVNGVGNDNGQNTPFSYTFEINSVGQPLTQQKALIYLGLLAIVIFLFVLNIFVMFHLPSKNDRDEEGFIVSVNNLKYLRGLLFLVAWALFIAIAFISSNVSYAYLGENLFTNFFFSIFNIMMSLSPVLIVLWFIWLFVKVFQDKETKRMLERGIPIEPKP